MTQQSCHVELASGVDARGLAEMVQIANKYKSTLHILAQNGKVNVKSIMGMMTLKLYKGEEITLVAEGEDESDAVTGLQGYLEGKGIPA